MNHTEKETLIHYLASFVTSHKLQLVDKILTQRTRYLTIVLEDIYQPHNASAVVRSCDCFGIQDLHIIEQNYSYRPNPDVALGSTKWISLYRYATPHLNNTTECFLKLKQQGYQIIAATLRDQSLPLKDFQLQTKTALCFGTEEQGLSTTAHELADSYLKIPMYGFTQSFNISVSAALFMYTLSQQLRSSSQNWSLTEEEKTDLKIEWLCKIIPNGEAIKDRFLK